MIKNNISTQPKKSQSPNRLTKKINYDNINDSKNINILPISYATVSFNSIHNISTIYQDKAISEHKQPRRDNTEVPPWNGYETNRRLTG